MDLSKMSSDVSSELLFDMISQDTSIMRKVIAMGVKRIVYRLERCWKTMFQTELVSSMVVIVILNSK
ncbi:hypothetical protein K2173_004615 [Erythroxylum novogranatense]|uniref:Uncharacterized protein n=1 Tax=Erythroxylum novogranatense TaxID=1862640 RepID=A0AAV8UCV4_9ROSI|nr:hypothetical protein K2173_004615 [Erythroxylum novogranatense]